MRDCPKAISCGNGMDYSIGSCSTKVAGNKAKTLIWTLTRGNKSIPCSISLWGACGKILVTFYSTVHVVLLPLEV